MIIVRSIPLYWGVETDPTDRSFLTRTFLLEDLPPYRESVWAFRIRVSPSRWLHAGVCRFRRDALHWGLNYQPNDIGRWGRRGTTQEEANGPRPDEVEQVQ